MKKLICLLLLLPLPLFAAPGNGVKFDEESSLPDVFARAELENKYIMVFASSPGCYWCYKMKTETFLDEKIAGFFNEKFISVKIEYGSMSGSAHNARWNQAGLQLKQLHGIAGFPAYVFFSPSGKMIKKDGGYMKPEDFMEVGNEIIDPDSELLANPRLLEKYLKEKEQSIVKMKELYYKLWDGDKPRNVNPDWTTLLANLENKCGAACATDAVFEARPRFYRSTLNFQKFVESIDEQMQKYPPRLGVSAAQFDSIAEFRLDAEWILNGTDDKALLERAVVWMESCEKAAANPRLDIASMHVRARLLQKLGRKDEAIATLQKAIVEVKDAAQRTSLALRKSETDTSKPIDELSATLEKVKKGEPSWNAKST